MRKFMRLAAIWGQKLLPDAPQGFAMVERAFLETNRIQMDQKRLATIR